MKKLFAAVLTLVMVASLSVPVLATTVSSGQAGTAIDSTGSFNGSIIVPTLTVTLKYFGNGSSSTASNNALVLNPFGTKVEGSSTTDVAQNKLAWVDSNGSTAQVLASPISIKSASNSAVDVVLEKGAKATKGNTNLVFATKEITKATAAPNAYLYMCATSGTDDATIPGEWPSYDKNSCWLVSDTDSAKDITLYTLPVPADTSNPTYAWVTITGGLSTEVTEGGLAWASDYTVSTTGKLKFNFALASE